ncbi:MAG: hypothetical protein GY906_20550 [bacterium]|nr:hypothetical protein [bacterium]
MGKRLVVLAAVLLSVLSASFVSAQQSEVESLIELLVQKGIITADQAVAIRASEDSKVDQLTQLLIAQNVITVDEAKVVTQVDAPRIAVAESATPAAIADAPVVKAEKKSWTDRLRITGDLRLRYEGFSQDNSFYHDRRDRFRIRLRPGLEATITDNLKAGFQLRNGDPNDPVSNNTSFDGGFQAKDFNLDQVYVDWRATNWLGLIGGKFDAGKRWSVSDFQWDDDVTVEGAMQNFGFGSNGRSFKGFKLATYQYSLEESKSNIDSYLFGAQLRSDMKLSSDNSLALGAGYDYWENPQAVVDLTLSGKLGGNKITNFLDQDNLLVSDFEILNLFAEWKNIASKTWPVKVNLFYYQNLGAKSVAKDQDTGYFVRLQVGDYKKPGQVAFRYSRYYSEPDALFYVFTQSDTSRASNVDGHRFDVRIGAVARSYFNLTWYNTRPSHGDDEELNRWQADYIIRF